MKRPHLLAALMAVAACASTSSAIPAEPTFPPGFVPIEVRRFVVDNWASWDHITGSPGQYGPPYNDETRLGWISSAPFEGSMPLYICQNNFPKDEHYTSAFADCEGRGTRLPSPHVLGHVAASQISGTIPLYRCVAAKNEFDSVHANCEGQGMIGVLGYIFP